MPPKMIRPDIFYVLTQVEFECGVYILLAKDFEHSSEKIKALINNARRQFCDHEVLDIRRVLIPKRILRGKKRKLKLTYILYCGNCAFGA